LTARRDDAYDDLISPRSPGKAQVVVLDIFGRRARKERERYGDRLPPRQRITERWPVFTAGSVPTIDLKEWRFTVSGLVEEHIQFTWDDFMSLPQTTVVSDVHCVTRWSRLDNRWEGVAFRELMGHFRPTTEAHHVMVCSYGGYTTNVPLADLMDDDVLFAHSHNGEPLTMEHGWPLRLVVPKLYFWKSAKWVRGLIFMAEERPGFWEQRGYHIRGDPFKEQRRS
jgi:DMSO/TMAO reductase YedYZ molybdopterin-dependent catalytic subunit